jgi:hypothetical protein
MEMKSVILPVILALVASLGTCSESSYRSGVSVEARPLNPLRIVRASHMGVSFTFDSSLASDVKAETIPEMASGKPCDLVPEHPLFKLLGYPHNDPEAKSTVRVFRLDKFREAFSTASGKYARSLVWPPNPHDWTLDFDKEVHVLKVLLATKPSVNVGRFLGKARGEKGCGQMPFLPMWEACQAFARMVKASSFSHSGIERLFPLRTRTSNTHIRESLMMEITMCLLSFRWRLHSFPTVLNLRFSSGPK